MDVLHTLLLFLAAVVSFGILVFILFSTFIGDAKGAPFTRSSPVEIHTMLDLAAIKKNELVFDLGSGDGTILIEAAKKDARGVGIELNPFLVWYSRQRIKYSGYKDKVSIKLGDFNRCSFKDADVVFLYLLPSTIFNIQEKLLGELKIGSRIVSNGIPFAGGKFEKVRNNIFLYRNIKC